MQAVSGAGRRSCSIVRYLLDWKIFRKHLSCRIMLKCPTGTTTKKEGISLVRDCVCEADY